MDDDTKINPNFAKFAMIALQDDLSVIQDAFEYGVKVSIKEEGREIVYGWLQKIPEFIGMSPQCTLERKAFVRKVCEKLMNSIGTFQERIDLLREIMEEQGLDNETKELLENLNRAVEKVGAVEARSQLAQGMRVLDQNPDLSFEQKERARRTIENYMYKLL